MTHPATEDDRGATSSGRPRGWLTGVLVAVIAVGLLLAGGGLAVALGVGREEQPTTDSVAAGFSRDMSRHHLQAVEMANLALTETTDPEIRQLAFDISATQTNQLGRMQGWLALWDLPFTGGETMAWMSDGEMAGHDMAGPETAGAALMPGMATEAELAELRSLSGTAFDRMFLQLMIRHHQGGLAMAEYGQEHADVDVVERLARSIAETQDAETTTMAAMLRARGGEPLPAP
ncbi:MULTISPECIES: DUF305 domain-containing protein [unclassified Modestobacter]|uniref:DUF305 domain-containing protein n=1 Tax=unclassified Modestobacter TaxID=2643866 RepID=UPI0022AA5162|nr:MULTISPECIES: DUF305 domain-containing protein [unclassified Modestobacter]MCZ2823937.1 DUF305 domain-containing protein [Modestobacter sp. VKM Ac-2981]MCZ2852182.1 DUF305 domain-containing protein [Modestobacter sp. VKM Ac-2982]